jgi:hypothetical protein
MADKNVGKGEARSSSLLAWFQVAGLRDADFLAASLFFASRKDFNPSRETTGVCAISFHVRRMNLQFAYTLVP